MYETCSCTSPFGFFSWGRYVDVLRSSMNCSRSTNRYSRCTLAVPEWPVLVPSHDPRRNLTGAHRSAGDGGACATMVDTDITAQTTAETIGSKAFFKGGCRRPDRVPP